MLVPERLAIWSWVLGYTAVLASLSILRYGLWVARGDDLGFYEQGLWLLLHRGLYGLSTYTGQPILGHSASYILLLLAPLYAVGGVGFLLVLQALGFGLGYYFIRRIGNDLKVAGGYAHLLGVLYLIYPTVLGVNLYDFHPEALGVPLLFGLIAALIEKRRTASLVLLLASFLVGASVAAVLAGLGVTLLLQRRVGWGVAAILVGLIGGYLDVHFVMQVLGNGAIGQGAGGGLVGLLQHPQQLIAWGSRVRSWEYMAWLLGPLSIVGILLGTRLFNAWWISVLPLMEVNLLSTAPALTSPFTEHSAMAVPFLFVALIWALRDNYAPMGQGWIKASVVPAMVLLVVFGVQQYRSYWRSAPANTSALDAAVAAVPPFAPVMAQEYVLPHLAQRPQEWQLGALGTMEIPAGTYVVLDQSMTTGTAPPGDVAKIAALLTDARRTTVVFSESGVIVGKLEKSVGPKA